MILVLRLLLLQKKFPRYGTLLHGRGEFGIQFQARCFGRLAKHVIGVYGAGLR